VDENEIDDDIVERPQNTRPAIKIVGYGRGGPFWLKIPAPRDGRVL